MRRLPVFFLLLLALAACKKMPSDVIRPDKMSRILADLHTAGAVVEINSVSWQSDSSRRALRQAVYDRYDVSSEQVDSSLMWYGHNLKDYVEVYEKTLAILDERIAEAEKVVASQLRQLKKLCLTATLSTFGKGRKLSASQ